MSRLVDAIRKQDFKASNIGRFFAQMRLLFDSAKIENPDQMYSLNDTGVSPDADVIGRRGQQAVTQKGNRAVFAHLNFKYQHRILVLVCVFADGTSVALAIVTCSEC